MSVNDNPLLSQNSPKFLDGNCRPFVDENNTPSLMIARTYIIPFSKFIVIYEKSINSIREGRWVRLRNHNITVFHPIRFRFTRWVCLSMLTNFYFIIFFSIVHTRFCLMNDERHLSVGRTLAQFSSLAWLEWILQIVKFQISHSEERLAFKEAQDAQTQHGRALAESMMIIEIALNVKHSSWSVSSKLAICLVCCCCCFYRTRWI